MIARLDYIASLGVDAIWISPFFKSPMKDFGYDVSEYRQVDPIFGTLEDFDRLVAAAHARGLRDHHRPGAEPHLGPARLVRGEPPEPRATPGRTGTCGPIPKPDGTPPNNWLSIFGGPAWQWEPRRGQYYLHNFLVSQPDLNYHNPAVAAQMLEEAEFWLARGVDGFRLDAINFCFHDPLLRDNPAKPEAERKGRGFRTDNPYAWQVHLYDNTQPQNHAFLEALRRLMDQLRAGGRARRGVGRGRRRGDRAVHLGQRSACTWPTTSSCWWTSSRRAHIREVVETLAARCEDCWPCWAIGNHDVARVASRWSDGAATAPRAKLFNALLLSLRGTVCSYQGEELGLTQAELPDSLLQDPYGLAFWPLFKGRDGCRTPMPWNDREPECGFTTGRPWLPVPAEHRALAVNHQDAAQDSVLNAYRAFVRWRRGVPALQKGGIRLLDSPPNTLLFLREHEGMSVLACFNFGSTPCEIRIPSRGRLEILAGHGFTACIPGRGVVTLPSCGAFFANLHDGAEASA